MYENCRPSLDHMVYVHTLFQKMVPIISLPNVMRTVKTLALLTAPDLDLVTEFLKCFLSGL